MGWPPLPPPFHHLRSIRLSFSGTKEWGRPRSSRASCTTNSSPHIRSQIAARSRHIPMTVIVQPAKCGLRHAPTPLVWSAVVVLPVGPVLLPGDHWDRFPFEDDVSRGPDCTVATMGHSWSRTIPLAHPLLYSRFLRRGHRIRHQQPPIIRQRGVRTRTPHARRAPANPSALYVRVVHTPPGIGGMCVSLSTSLLTHNKVDRGGAV